MDNAHNCPLLNFARRSGTLDEVRFQGRTLEDSHWGGKFSLGSICAKSPQNFKPISSSCSSMFNSVRVLSERLSLSLWVLSEPDTLLGLVRGSQSVGTGSKWLLCTATFSSVFSSLGCLSSLRWEDNYLNAYSISSWKLLKIFQKCQLSMSSNVT